MTTPPAKEERSGILISEAVWNCLFLVVDSLSSMHFFNLAKGVGLERVVVMLLGPRVNKQRLPPTTVLGDYV